MVMSRIRKDPILMRRSVLLACITIYPQHPTPHLIQYACIFITDELCSNNLITNFIVHPTMLMIDAK